MTIWSFVDFIGIFIYNFHMMSLILLDALIRGVQWPTGDVMYDDVLLVMVIQIFKVYLQFTWRRVWWIGLPIFDRLCFCPILYQNAYKSAQRARETIKIPRELPVRRVMRSCLTQIRWNKTCWISSTFAILQHSIFWHCPQFSHLVHVAVKQPQQ